MTPVLLEPGGGLSHALPSYEDRPGQRRMAEAVAAAIEHTGVAVIEAGTGTGKTLAYLVPAALSRARVIVSTGTRALQDQIVRHDLPLLAELVPHPVTAAVVKGADNYLCRRRFDQAFSTWRPEATSDDLATVAEWLHGTRTGDRSELFGLAGWGDDHPLWARISTSSEGRLAGRCPHIHHCFVARARRRADEADIVVVNHALFFADLALRLRGGDARVLPDYDAVIFDEAHLIEDAMTEHLARSVSSAGIARLTTDLTRLANRLHAGAGVLHRPDRDLESEARGIDDAWRQLAREIQPHLPGPGEAASRVELPAGALTSEAALRAWYAMDDRLAACVRLLEARAEDVRVDGDGVDPVAAEAEAFARRIRRVRDDLAAVADTPSIGTVRMIERHGTGVVVKAAPSAVGDEFAEHVVRSGKAVVLTSATLSCAGSFEHVRARLGIEADTADELRIDSPFDYQQQTLLYVAGDLPDPREPDYPGAACGRIAELVDITGGRSLVLFTSHRLLSRAVESLRGWLDVPLLCQGDAPAAELLRQFQSDEASVLLATGTFWQGIDVPGPSLSQVIIDKLPFAPPDDPLMRARGRDHEERGGDAFYDVYVPAAAIAFRQGVGRLIRRKDDRGLVSVLDRRLIARRYGQVFIDSLPPMPRTASLERARRWWERRHE